MFAVSNGFVLSKQLFAQQVGSPLYTPCNCG